MMNDSGPLAARPFIPELQVAHSYDKVRISTSLTKMSPFSPALFWLDYLVKSFEHCKFRKCKADHGLSVAS